MKVSIRELRNSIKRILVTLPFGKDAIAEIAPIKTSDTTNEDYSFGMWRDNAATEDVAQYVRKLRSGSL